MALLRLGPLKILLSAAYILWVMGVTMRDPYTIIVKILGLKTCLMEYCFVLTVMVLVLRSLVTKLAIDSLRAASTPAVTDLVKSGYFFKYIKYKPFIPVIAALDVGENQREREKIAVI